MDSLPVDAVESLCRYLTTQEIATCCLVCRPWRDAFNKDVIWKPRCSRRLQLEEHLRTTPCAVQPSFSFTKPADGNLSEPCQWKLAYMREKHLWNNISKGQCKETEIIHVEDKGYLSGYGFLNDDLVYLIFKSSIEVWDTRADPTVKISERVHNLTDNEVKSLTVVGKAENIAMVVDGFRVRLFNIDFKAGCLLENSSFFYDSNKEGMCQRTAGNGVPKYVVSSSTFLGVSRGSSNVLHVWDLTLGQKILEDKVTIPEFQVVDIFGSQTTSKVVIVLAPEKQEFISHTDIFGFFCAEDGHFVYRLYCLKEKRFLKFQEESPSTNGYSCAILKDFVAIWDKVAMRIFNYERFEMLYQGEGARFDQCSFTVTLSAVGDFFLFPGPFSSLTIFNPKTKFIYTDEKCKIDFIVFSCNELRVLKELLHLGKSCFYVFDSDEKNAFRIAHENLEKLGISNCHGINASGTRYITCSSYCTTLELFDAIFSAWDECRNENPSVEKKQEKKMMTIKHFW